MNHPDERIAIYAAAGMQTYRSCVELFRFVGFRDMRNQRRSTSGVERILRCRVRGVTRNRTSGSQNDWAAQQRTTRRLREPAEVCIPNARWSSSDSFGPASVARLSTSRIQIRNADILDLPVLSRFGAELARLHSSFDVKQFTVRELTETAFGVFFAEQLGRQDAVLLVAEQDGATVGYAFVRMGGRES